MHWQATLYNLPPSDDYPFYITANRYVNPEWDHLNTQSSSNQDSLTLIVLHSTSFHKEIWEPTLSDLVELINGKSRNTNRNRIVNIQDIWAIECPNHGASAELNFRGRADGNFDTKRCSRFSCQKYAEAVHRFLNSAPHHSHGPRVDFRQRKLVGVGHSLGANALLILQSLRPQFNFASLIIVEPMVSALGTPILDSLKQELITRARRRKNVWRSPEEARRSLVLKSFWDPRVLDVFIKHALYWEPEKDGYTLHCSREQEIIMYEDMEGPTKPVEVLNTISHTLPIHILIGERADFIPAHVHQALVDPLSGRKFSSVSYMKHTGHLIPQEQPAALGKYLFDILTQGHSSSTLSPPLHRL